MRLERTYNEAASTAGKILHWNISFRLVSNMTPVTLHHVSIDRLLSCFWIFFFAPTKDIYNVSSHSYHCFLSFAILNLQLCTSQWGRMSIQIKVRVHTTLSLSKKQIGRWGVVKKKSLHSVHQFVSLTIIPKYIIANSYTIGCLNKGQSYHCPPAKMRQW